MEYTNLPGTSLKISRVCLGTMLFGGQTSEADSLKIMDYAFEQGINHFDTANIYLQGEGEKIVGKALKGRRNSIILASKVCNQMGENPNDAGLSRRHILSAVEASLKRLDTDYIDLYYQHAPDNETALEETLDAMSGLVRSGKIRYYGVSNYPAWQIADMLAVCDKRGFLPPIVTQNVYNLLTRGIEDELAPFLKAHGMGMIVYNPIAGGMLAGKHKPGTPAENTRFWKNKMYLDRYWMDENFKAVETLAKIASDHGMSLLRLAMKWCLQQECVTSVLSGVSRLEQLQQNIDSVSGAPLGQEVLSKCDEVWRGLVGNRFNYIR
ncbi:MAG: aldo/keto reductase [Spirochaetaceae bacterium]|nr:aldo/keto reductase [Spirochaetaceae bacterium]